MRTIDVVPHEERLRLTATAALLERYREYRGVPRPVFEARFSDARAAADYFRQSCEACEEILALYQVGATEWDRLRAEVEELKEAIANRLQPIESGSGLVELQRAVIQSLSDSLQEIPDGTYLAISYEGKVLGRASTMPELAGLLASLGISRRQVFIHLKGSPAAFRAV
jgi:hypothetical protein